MKRIIIGIFLSLMLIIILISCTDDIAKIQEIAQKVRIEFSKCSGCYECINDFNCPYDAIKIDERTFTTYIDGEKCVQCMKCINNFSCPENAILIERDIIAPGNIADFSAVSDTLGKLEIQFTAPGDDDTLGLAYRYELTLKDQNNQTVQTDFEIPLPHIAGYVENWIINELPPEELITVNLQAFDEVNQFSETVSLEVLIQGEYIDEIAPAAITDLISNSFEDSLELIWSAVGDDGLEGTAFRYEVRYNENEINDSNWDSATEFSQNIIPSQPGVLEQLFIDDLPQQINYFFAIKAFDEEDNPSEISNNTTASIIGDIVSPADINDLTINSVSSNSILLNWTAVGDDDYDGTADSYIIKIHTESIDESNWQNIPEIEQSVAPQNAGITESFLLTDLEPLTSYYAAIKVLDDVQNISNLSNIVNTVTTEIPDEIPPGQITDLTATPSETEIELIWTAPGDDDFEGTAYQYDIRISNDPITDANWGSTELLPNSLAPLPAGNEQNYFVQNLEQDLDYYFGIKTIDESNNISELSNCVNAALLEDTTPPAQITDLSALETEDIIILTWTAVGDNGMEGQATSYEIRFSDEEISENNWSEAELLPNPPQPSFSGTSETYVAYNLTPGINYFFAIKAIDENLNYAEISNNAQAEIFLDNIPPAAITNLVALDEFNIYSYRIKLQWIAPGDDDNEGTASYYDIRYSSFSINDGNWNNATQFSNPPDPESAGTQQTCEISGLAGGTIYYFAIKTYDDNDNESEISNSPGGKIVFQINHGACHDCSHCINDCPVGAISDVGPYKTIDPDLCDACGTCTCPYNLIKLSVVAY